MAEHIEKGTNYAYTIERIQGITFKALRSVVVDFIRRLPSSLTDELYHDIKHGVSKLQNEPELNMYIHALGMMHEAKLHYAFEHISEEFAKNPTIDIIDYGCGQAIGTICYADFLRHKGIIQTVRRITLIEPSEIALKRAALHVTCFFPDAEIITILKDFDNLDKSDIRIDEEVPTLNILSNVIDLADDYFNLEKFVCLLNECSIGKNQFICIEPYFDYDETDEKLDRFVKLLEAEIYHEKSFSKGTFIEGRDWTCRVVIGKIPLRRNGCGGVNTPLIELDWKEEEKEVKRLLKIAEENDTSVLYSLGFHYKNGDGIKRDYKEAFKWFHKAAEQGHIEANYELGLFYEYGYGVIQSYFKAIEWYLRAAEQEHITAQFSLGYCYEKTNNYSEAIKWFRKLAEEGFEIAQCRLGEYYEEGREVCQNTLEALRWYHKAEYYYKVGECLEKMRYYTEAVKWYTNGAKGGCEYAMNCLGRCYINGRGIEKNEKKAVEWFCKAAEQGYAKAQCNLGLCYLKGEGVKKNEIKAFEWFKEAEERGFTAAQSYIGLFYATGKGVTKDEVIAAEWFRKAAEQGHANAQFQIGVCYKNGQGVEKDENKAVEWYLKAAEQGYARAQNNLGVCYKNGEGVEKDESKAVEWFCKAAEQGHDNAQCNLGLCYLKGKGVTKDEFEAAIWLCKAAEQGNLTAKEVLNRLIYKT